MRPKAAGACLVVKGGGDCRSQAQRAKGRQVGLVLYITEGVPPARVARRPPFFQGQLQDRALPQALRDVFGPPARMLRIEDGEGAHGRAGPTLELERHAEELEFALADQFFQIHQPLPMAHAEIAAEPMLGKDVVCGPIC